ncbi:MAG: Spx/MgsR family RNA polymerase-binding regulatory protein [Gammaproteobacteria bacterium]|jgi:Spx/MgsR family transcriptional regulator
MPTDKVILYGLKQCDSCRRAGRWLDEAGVAWELRDIREAELSATELDELLRHLGPRLINRRSTTYRQLDNATRNALDGPDAARVLAEHPTLIKRPLLCQDGRHLIGTAATQVREWLE